MTTEGTRRPVTVRVTFSVDIDPARFAAAHPGLNPRRVTQLRNVIRRECEAAALDYLYDHELVARDDHDTYVDLVRELGSEARGR